jgi:serine/threonine-protein kinase HipA
MLIKGEQRSSKISLCLEAAPLFLLDVDVATELVGNQIKTIKKFWTEVCDAAALNEVDRNFMWRRQFLNAFAFVDAPDSLSRLVEPRGRDPLHHRPGLNLSPHSK